MITDNQILRINRIEEIIQDNVRNLSWFTTISRAAVGGLLSAAKSIVQHPQPHICVVTGLYLIHGEPPCCETDGPIGAAHLVAAFNNVGFPCRLLTDRPSAAAIAAAARGAGLPPDFPIDIASVDGSGGDRGTPLEEIEATWKRQNPPISHIISIERIGMAADGVPRNMRGIDIRSYNAPLEKLFYGAPWTTIGIGDGGNEIGMGSIYRAVRAANMPNGDKSACVVPCDHLIVATISNWGAVGLIGAIAILRPELRDGLMRGLTPEQDLKILQETVFKGPAISMPSWNEQPAVQVLRVDGETWEVQADIIEKVIRVVQ
jgi:hypothetical protein